jgi:LPXTG-motif cell wall-anchored protein
MTFEDMDNINLDETPPPEESGNRPFLIVAGILGAFTLIALVCIAAYALYYVPQQRYQQSTQIAQVNAQNTQVAESIIQTSIAEAFTSTPTVTATPLEATYTPTNTPVIVLPSATAVIPAGGQAATQDPRTATVAALLTQAAVVQQTSMPTATSTGLPTTGFADQVGVPGLIGLAILLIAVIIFARRLRTSG